MLKKILTNLGLLILLLVLCFPITYLFGFIYKGVVTHPMSLSFWGPDPYLFGGFLMSVMFTLSIYLTLSLKRLWAIIACIILNVAMLYVFQGVWLEDLIILVASSIAGYLLAELLKFSYHKLKK